LADVSANGRYHEIKVRLPDGPKRARLSHRPGYYAPKPVADQSEMERRVDAAELLRGGRERLDFSAEIRALPPSDYLTEASVPVVIEIAGSELEFKRARRGLTLEIQGYCFDPAGNLEDLFASTIEIEPRQVEKILEQGGLRFLASLRLPAGEHELRVLVRDRRTGKTHLSVTELSVEPSHSREPALQPPIFVASTRHWLIVDTRSRRTDAPDSLAIGGRRQIPSLVPVLQPGQAAAIAIKGVHLDKKGLELRTRILDLEGSPVAGGQLTLDRRWLDSSGRLDGLTATFTARDLSPGTYLLEIAAVWATGTRESTAATQFTVARAGSPPGVSDED
jgi:hypothetical protein